MAGFFSHATGVIIDRTTMNDVQGDQYNQTMKTTIINFSAEKRNVLDSLRPADQSRFYAKPCMEGTRVSIFKQIDAWMADPNGSNILWIKGSPGAGKSAIASSLVSKLAASKYINASFFFKRGDVMLSDPAVVWRTISSALCGYHAEFADAVVESLETKVVDPVRPDIANHFKHLIEEPLMGSLNSSDNVPAVVVVIDALDECGLGDYSDSQRQIFLQTLHRWASFDRKFKLIITGRDDRMPDSLRNICQHLELLTGSNTSPDSDKDLQLFFQIRLAEIFSDLSQDWSGESIINRLTERAAGLFIWAETMSMFLHQDVPEEQLRQILDGRFGGGDDIDQLYSQILDSSFRRVSQKTLKSVQILLRAIVLARTPLFYDDLRHIVPEVDTSTADFILKRLSSVISTRGPKKQLSVSHLSFTDFLCDQSRCSELFAVDLSKGNLDYALSCLRLMEKFLRFNICGLETSHLANDAVPNCLRRVEENISSYQLYSSRFWASHLSEAKDVGEDDLSILLSDIRTFFAERLLFWLEIMSLTKAVSEATIALTISATWLESHSAELSLWAKDSSLFTRYFHEPISKSVPHIYLSALPFAPTDSWVYKQYRAQYSRTISVRAGADTHWPACVHSLLGHTEGVGSVAFSPDQKKIVSGSWDGTLRIWDAQTGQTVLGPFKIPYASGAICVRFSKDGRSVIGCTDCHIGIWDVELGQLKSCTSVMPQSQGFVASSDISPDCSKVAYACGWPGHLNKIFICDANDGRQIVDFDVENGLRAIAFSPDSTRVVSGDCRGIVCIWDIMEGAMIAGPFAHDDRLEDPFFHELSVAFSSCGTKIVSGGGKTVWVRDASSGQVIAGPFQGHKWGICVVSFSPDDRFVASGSGDSVRVWDLNTGKTIAGPFEGHTLYLTSLCFSLDGSTILSASADRTVCVWDVKAGVAPDHSDCHMDRISSVCLSLDETRIASAAADKTLRIWDVNSGRMLLDMTSPSDVHVLRLSADGQKFAFSSSDDDIGNISVWDVNSGKLTAGPFKTRPGFSPFTMSPDGSKIVSSLSGGAIGVWDIKLGQLISTSSLEGHTNEASSLCFCSSGQNFASGSESGTIYIWNVDDGEMVLGPLHCPAKWIRSLCFSLDDTRLVAGCDHSTVYVWDATIGELCYNPLKINDYLRSATISADGTKIFGLTQAGSIMIWDASNGDQMSMIPCPSNPLAPLMLSQDGGKFAFGDDDGVQLWSFKGLETGGGADKSSIAEDLSKDWETTGPINVYQLLGCRSGKSHGWARLETIDVGLIPLNLRKNSFFDQMVEIEPAISHSSDSRRSSYSSPLSSSTEQVFAEGSVDFPNSNGRSAVDQRRDVVEEPRSPDAEIASSENILRSNEGIHDAELPGPSAQLMNTGDLLFWVPPAHRHILCDMERIWIMGSRRTQVDFSNFVHGNSWTKCRSPHMGTKLLTQGLL